MLIYCIFVYSMDFIIYGSVFSKWEGVGREEVVDFICVF